MIQFRSLKPLARKIKTAQSRIGDCAEEEKHLSNLLRALLRDKTRTSERQFIEGKRQSGEKKEPLDSFVKKAHNMCTLFVYTMKTKKSGFGIFARILGIW
jgi:uncharacterized protein (DUF342 family)